MNSTTIVSAQDKGPRENLEDDFGAFSLSLPGPKPLDVTVALLADGVGGAQHGEVASAMTIREVKSSLAASIAGLDPKTDSHALDAGSIFNLLDEALRAANTAVLAKTDEDLENKGMSTTVVCAVIANEKIHVAWAGDSRCYVYRNGRIKQITRDHSEIQPLVDAGLMNEEQARTHPLSHAINRFVGMGDGFTADKAVCNLSHGDIILLCSDGLTDVLSNRRITQLVRRWRLLLQAVTSASGPSGPERQDNGQCYRTLL